MRKILLYTLLLLLCTSQSYGQYSDTVFQYLDINWKQVNPEKEYYYYMRIAKKTTEGTWHVKDFYRDTKQLQSEGICIDDSMKIYDGKVYYYHYNGSLHKECSYYRGTPVGLMRRYTIDGKLTDSTRFKSTGIPYHKSFKWDESGNLIFYGDYDMKGSGEGYETAYYTDSTISLLAKYTKGYVRDSTWSYYRSDGTLSFTETYDSGKLVSYQCYDTDGITTIANCDTAAIKPEPGYNVYQLLNENIHMPMQAKEDGLHGRFTVRIKFRVGIDGRILAPHIDYGSFDFFNEEALRVVREMPRWKPGRYKNRTVEVYYTLPVYFALEY